ncbi:MAG: DedA family protein [Candidatus Delongbacteria bacterium]|nr:DedA family protein [Candidatus Delongbacteria bacterium]
MMNKPNFIRRIYDWVLHWADTPYGVPALFLLSFSESSFFPVPPDVLLIALAVSKPKKAFYYASVCSAASIIGGILGYGIGWTLWGSVSSFFFDYIPGFTPANFELIRQKYELYNFWVVFTAGFTPIPYKLITITAGVFNINFIMFIIASAISRSLRFFLVSAIIYKFGAPIKIWIEKYFNLAALLFTVLLIGGFLIVKYFM